MKQVIVMRKDLNMRKGKMIAQGAHASMKCLLDHPYVDYRIKKWLDGKFTKVVVSVDSEEELLDVYYKALNKGLIVHLIEDAGLTEFHGIATKTCIAVGPDKPEMFEGVTDDLKLL